MAVFFAFSVSVLALAQGAGNAAAGAAVDDFTFLKSNMPIRDRGKVSDEYLRANVKLAREALEAAPWKDTIDEETFREYILPYSSIGEGVDDWRPIYRETFWPLVKNCKTTTEAVQIINSKIWNTLNVHYDTRRDRADQSPFHSMRIHMASCTGLTIIQVDVYRACGIPARFVGCLWTKIPGNHSWPEYYDQGSWHFFGDAEADKILPRDQSWYAPYAAQADESRPEKWIFATRWSVNKQGYLWGAWGRPVPVDNVTASYKRFAEKVKDGRVAVVLRNAAGRRVPTPVRFVAPDSKKVMAEGVTFDETHDLNDHLIVKLPERTMANIEAKQADGTFKKVGYVEFGSQQQLVELKGE